MMLMKAALIIFALMLILAVAGSIHDARKPRVRTIIQSKDDRAIVGDGAWDTTRATYPSERLRRLREIEPRGV